jgi:hypothetical protein
MSTKSVKRRVAPLEHIVHPEGHIMQGKHKEVSGTLGARSAVLKGMSRKENRKRRVTPLEHLVRPEGHVVLGPHNVPFCLYFLPLLYS